VAGSGRVGSVPVSVHGPAGVLDLLVPPGTTGADLAGEYAARAGLASIPRLYTRVGVPVAPDASLASAGVDAGDLVVAATSVPRPPSSPEGPGPRPAPPGSAPGPASVLWFAVACSVAALAGWTAAHGDSSATRSATVLVLLAASLLGALPLGRYAVHRAHAAPAFAAAAAFVVVWDPDPERWPMVAGLTGLAGAVAAAVARAVDDTVDEGLRAWMVAGSVVFLTSGAAALLGLGAAVVWSTLLVLCVLAARLVPGFAVDVPDQLLVDLERLAVTAWSARDLPRGRRGRAVASGEAVAVVAARGARLVTAAGVAIAVVAVVSSGMLLTSANFDLDQVGARYQVFFAGAALMLAGRSYRHAGARTALRSAGLGGWALLAGVVLSDSEPGRATTLAGVAVGVALTLVVVAVAAGRGWRSAWWARRAEVAEALSGAIAVAALFVATGFCRTVWELTSNVDF
jgi:hypothetical protein